MESKIERIYKLVNEYALISKLPNKTKTDVAIKIVEMDTIMKGLLDLYLNSQAQPEEIDNTKLVMPPSAYEQAEKEGFDMRNKVKSELLPEDTPEEWSWKFLKGGCEPTDYSKQPKMEEELHDKLLEIWCGLLPTPSKASFDPEPIRIRIEGTEKYVKQLLEEREREVRKSVLKEVREWLFSYLDKLNKEE